MENAIRNAIIKFEQEFIGHDADDLRADIVRDLVVVRSKGVLTPADLHGVNSKGDSAGSSSDIGRESGSSNSASMLNGLKS